MPNRRLVVVGEATTLSVRVSDSEAFADLDAFQVDALIDQLAAMRAKMTPAIGAEPSSTTMKEALIDPPWRCVAQRSRHGHVIAYRHPGLGWRAIVLPLASGTQLADSLLEQAEASITEDAKPKN